MYYMANNVCDPLKTMFRAKPGNSVSNTIKRI